MGTAADNIKHLAVRGVLMIGLPTKQAFKSVSVSILRTFLCIDASVEERMRGIDSMSIFALSLIKFPRAHYWAHRIE